MIMLTKTNELTDAALRWVVAECEGITVVKFKELDSLFYGGGFNKFAPDTDWNQGGPIIEREITKVFRNVGGTWSAMVLKDVSIPPEDRGTSLALTRRAQWNGAGPTPLIAAMRCYVASKLGNEVDIPKELL